MLKMKKLLIFLIMIGLIVMPMVIANGTMTLNQGVSVQVGEGIVVSITPDNLDFGKVTPSSTHSAGPSVTFNVTGSNIDLTISSSIEGQDALFQGISFVDNSVSPAEIKPITGFSIAMPVSNQVKTFGTQILIPIGTLPGTKTGTIVYTITGPTP